MFGYVMINSSSLTTDQQKRYRGYYCGLCRTLGIRHGTASRMTLTYDMTFLAFFLSAFYDFSEKKSFARCMVHPKKKHEEINTKMTEYAADMNIALSYFHFIDDWNDDKSVRAYSMAKLFERSNMKIGMEYPRQSKILKDRLCKLSEIEKDGEINPDIPANCFGEIIAEIFVWDEEDENAEQLWNFGLALGKFIYMLDACLDLKDDIRKKRYNPLMLSSSEDFQDILTLLMADVMKAYDRIFIKRDSEIIENILYSGIWTKYNMYIERTKKAK